MLLLFKLVLKMSQYYFSSSLFCDIKMTHVVSDTRNCFLKLYGPCMYLLPTMGTQLLYLGSRLRGITQTVNFCVHNGQEVHYGAWT